MKNKVCTDCALLRNNNGICPYFQESFTSENNACPKFVSSLTKCDICGRYAPETVWDITEEGSIHYWCYTCSKHSGGCPTCNRKDLCVFETDPSSLPKIVTQQTIQGNAVMITQVKNPERIKITCAEKCKCYSTEFGCLKEKGCCCYYAPIYEPIEE